MLEKRSARVVIAAVLGLASVAGAGASLHARGEAAVAGLESARCAPIRVVDRYGKLLREVPGSCAPYGRSRWTRLAEVPPIVAQLVVESEDRRFRLHPGVDPVAVVRAAWSNVRARRVVSGASTLTMQLARLLEAAAANQRKADPSLAKPTQVDSSTRDRPTNKKDSARPSLSQARTALAIELDADDDQEPSHTGTELTVESGAENVHAELAKLSPPSAALALEPGTNEADPALAELSSARATLALESGADKEHSWLAKLSRAWTALALERRLRKEELLEAYLNLAYYGAGAYGIDAAAHAYFGRSLAALSDAESSLLATLPRAPARYDLRRDSTRATRRRDQILARLVQRGELDAARSQEIADTPIHVVARANAPETRAGHFVDYALAQLPASARRTGGELRTTLDLELQTILERAVVEHVASLADRDVDQAGLVVLDADTGAIRAMVGSRGYDASQVNITVRRRQLGSLLKPFVYALAIERGESAASIALDVGDVSAEYRARDWVGREAGPLSFREALAGSYNLAAIHTLERVGVAALHARLRSAGVAELAAPPARYGLMLALGSARVRLLDVASGYGFLVRGGLVRPAHAIEELAQAAHVWAPTLPADREIFSSAVSWQVMDILSDTAARHRRFGRGLPIESTLPFEDANPVSAKTGTASGMSDASAILATREFIVAAWAGRFDGKPTRGTSGMWAAAPLANRALIAALGGKSGSLPTRPRQAPHQTVAAFARQASNSPPPSDEASHQTAAAFPRQPGNSSAPSHEASHQTVATFARQAGNLSAHPTVAPPHTVAAVSGGAPLTPPPELEPWAERARARAGRTRESTSR